jgi:hypothetical protein
MQDPKAPSKFPSPLSDAYLLSLAPLYAVSENFLELLHASNEKEKFLRVQV